MANYTPKNAKGYYDNRIAYTPYVNNMQKKQNMYDKIEDCYQTLRRKMTKYFPNGRQCWFRNDFVVTGWRLSKDELIYY
jgi:hypothetical protein